MTITKKVISFILLFTTVWCCSFNILAVPVVPEEEVQPYVYSGGKSLFWGFEYYYQTESAYYDMYWRIWNPQNTTTPQKYFFSEFDTTVHHCAENYRDIVQDIESLEGDILAFTTLEVVQLITDGISIGVAVKKGSVANIAEYIKETIDDAKDIPAQAVEFIAQAYVYADQANRAYADVLDAIENRDEQ